MNKFRDSITCAADNPLGLTTIDYGLNIFVLSYATSHIKGYAANWRRKKGKGQLFVKKGGFGVRICGVMDEAHVKFVGSKTFYIADKG